MKRFDRHLRRTAAAEPRELPDSVRIKVEQTLAALPDKTPVPIRRRTAWRAVGAAAACLVFVSLFLLPNISVAYAQTLEKIPVIGDLVRVVTLRNYLYSDDYHEMDIQVPQIDAGSDDAADTINQDIRELTSRLVHQFYEDLEIVGQNGHGSIYVDYETVTDTASWFTLKLRVVSASGSGNTYFKYYHIDKRTGEIVQLGDLAADDSLYEAVEQDVKRQMEEAMGQDDAVIYWINDSAIGRDCVSVTADHNFYWNQEGDLVIPFDKYEVAPGSMGTPVFTVEREKIQSFLKPAYGSDVP